MYPDLLNLQTYVYLQFGKSKRMTKKNQLGKNIFFACNIKNKILENISFLFVNSNSIVLHKNFESRYVRELFFLLMYSR